MANFLAAEAAFMSVREEAASSDVPRPKIPFDTFLGIVWAGTALSLLCVLLRLYLRFRGPGRLHLDDSFIVVAEMMVVTTAGLWQWEANSMYYILEAASGDMMPKPELLSGLQHWLKVQVIVHIFFYTTLLLVKLSFLFFTRRLGHRVQGHKYIWWPVLIIAVLAWAISTGTIPYKCYVSPIAVMMEYCFSDEANQYRITMMKVHMALDVFSDFLIILIPVSILWNVRLPLKKKLAFIGLFSLSVITIVIAIVRAVSVRPSRDARDVGDVTYLWRLWSSIQSSLAVVVACLSAFPQLFSISVAKKRAAWSPTDTHLQRIRRRVAGSQHREISLADESDAEGKSPGGNDDARKVDCRNSDSASYDSQRLWLRPSESPQHPTAVH